MGKRARAKGVTSQALRKAQAVVNERDAQASEFAQAVYVAATQWKDEAGPMHLAGLTVSAMSVSRAVAMVHELPEDDQTLQDIGAFLVEKFLETCDTMDVAEFTEWRVSSLS